MNSPRVQYTSTEITRSVEMRLGEQHARRFRPVGEQLDATDPQQRTELLPRPIVPNQIPNFWSR